MKNKLKAFDRIGSVINKVIKINYSDETFEPISVEMISSDGIKIIRNISDVILMYYIAKLEQRNIEIYEGQILKTCDTNDIRLGVAVDISNNTSREIMITTDVDDNILILNLRD